MNKKDYLSPAVIVLEIECQTDVLVSSPYSWNDRDDYGMGDVQILGGES